MLGSRAWRVNFEAVSLNSRHMIRRCLVLWWKDLNPETLHQTITSNLGAVLIVLPESLSSLEEADRQVRTVSPIFISFSVFGSAF